MAYRRRDTSFTLCIFRKEYDRICSTVAKSPSLETGGNLFGLWTNSSNPVVLVALGPGQACRRTAVSFYQDIPYLQRVGGLLTEKFPLCHIGEWHSHHRMNLFEPSGGDCSTVVRNYPEGSQGFVLVIANIAVHKGMDAVVLSPYMFTQSSAYYTRGEVEIFEGESPFVRAHEIESSIRLGRETTPPSNHGMSQTRKLPALPGNDSPDNEEISHQSTRTRSRSPVRGVGTVQKRSPSPTRRKTSLNRQQTRVHEDEPKFTPSPPSKPKPETQGAIFPNSSFRKKRATRENREGENDGRKRPAMEDLERHHSTERSSYRAVEDCTAHQQWYTRQEGQEALKEIRGVLKALADDGEVSITRKTNTEDLSLGFKHHGGNFLVEFPSSFPVSWARLKKESSSPITGHMEFECGSLITSREPITAFLLELKVMIGVKCSRRTCQLSYYQNTRWT